jgi:hypothetical protein
MNKGSTTVVLLPRTIFKYFYPETCQIIQPMSQVFASFFACSDLHGTTMKLIEDLRLVIWSILLG